MKATITATATGFEVRQGNKVWTTKTLFGAQEIRKVLANGWIVPGWTVAS